MNKGLASWFAIWHPRYRVTLVQLILAGMIAGGLIYVQNDFLGLLTQSLTETTALSAAPAAGNNGTWGFLSDFSTSLGIGLPFFILGIFILSRIIAAGIEFWKTYATGKLKIRTENDIETEILVHLLRKDDAFFNRHSPSDTVNRLVVDLLRVSRRRPNLMNVCWSALLLIGHLVFFFKKDWRLAIVALAACVAGAIWTQRATRHARDMDSEYLEQDDRVKSRFEDFLWAATEVQVGHLYGKIRKHFRELQDKRTSTFLRYVRLNAVLRSGNMVSYLLAFVAMVIVVLYLKGGGTGNSALVLVPVVIWALPSLFENASSLIFLNLDFQLARTSMKRLLEYEAHEAPEPGPDVSEKEPQTITPDGLRVEHEAAPTRPPGAAPPAEPISIESATYRYIGPDGTRPGGVTEIDAAFNPGRLTVIVGSAGSGKSTLLKLILGRLKPQDGEVLYGQMPLDEMTEDNRAAILSIMPQRAALLDSTILQNLVFGLPATAPFISTHQLSEADMEMVELAGLGKLCRLKALDMTPKKPTDYMDIDEGIYDIRSNMRDRLRVACDVAVLPYEEGYSDLKHWLLEWLIGGKCDSHRSVTILLEKANNRKLAPILQTQLGDELIEFGRGVLREALHLLSISNYHVYSQLAPFPLDERLWRLRSSSVDLAERSFLSQKESLALCKIALTSSPSELAGDERSKNLRRPGIRDKFSGEISHLKELLGDACRQFAVEEVHPYLSWRENIVFGVVDIPNSRTGRLVDQAILELVEQEILKDTFTRLGLEYEIGRLGGNLSDGQRQLVALCRALLRRTPVLVLDEPTSAMDPASRTRVVELLRAWKAGRIVITVSHDPEFVREGDEIKLMEGGRLVASGTFEELETGPEAFHRALRQV